MAGQIELAEQIHAPCGMAGAARQFGDAEFRRLLEALPAGAYTCDPDGLITYYNQHAVALWGRAPRLNDAQDRFCGSFKLFAADGGAAIRHDQCWMALALQQNREYNGHEIVVERPDGRRMTVLAYANPFRDASGRLIGAVNVLVDISDRKRAEEGLRDADRSKDEFLATLAHELRNPLAPIRHAIEVLRQRGDSGDSGGAGAGGAPAPAPAPAAGAQDAKWALEVIDRQVGQMTRLVDDLLDVSRITRNKLELRIERIDLADAIRAALETSRPLIEGAAGGGGAGHELTVTLADEPLCLHGDVTRLAQAIANLLNNAAKYTAGRGHIWLSAQRQGSDAVVSVRDTGVGIPADMLPRIFDMFTQVERSLTRAQGGLGIGLTLVKRLIELHGGSVEARSDGPGRGSEFIVRLPILLEPSRARGAPGGRAGRSAAAAGTPLRILVVDENRDSANSLAMLLRITGNETRTAYDGLEAVGIAEEFRPAVVLLDIGLPRMSGYEAAQHIRKQSWGAPVILIAITGWGQDADKQRSHDAGFDHHMVKPVDLAALSQILSSLRETLAAADPARA